MKKLLFISTAAIAAMLTGCASPATVQGMVSNTPPTTLIRSHLLKNNISVTTTQGGRSTNPIGKSQVNNQSFKAALIASLQKANLYATLSSSHYNLTAHLLELKKPFVGISMTDECKVHYKIIDKKTHKIIFNKIISNQYTAKFSSAIFGIKRLRLANEGVIRNNIKILIEKLYKLNIPTSP